MPSKIIVVVSVFFSFVFPHPCLAPSDGVPEPLIWFLHPFDADAAVVHESHRAGLDSVTLGTPLFDMDKWRDASSVLWHAEGSTINPGHASEVVRTMRLENVPLLADIPNAYSVISELIGNVYHGLKTSLIHPPKKLLWAVEVISRGEASVFHFVLAQHFIRAEDWDTLKRVQALSEKEGLSYLRLFASRVRDHTFHNSSGSGLRMFYFLQTNVCARLRYSFLITGSMVTELWIDLSSRQLSRAT